jgi:hypothetical protein
VILSNFGGYGDFGVPKTKLLVKMGQKRFKLVQKQLKTINLT